MSHTASAGAEGVFGQDFTDPLAGVDTSVPAGVEAEVLARYCLMLADDALVWSHRLAQWCARAPELEEDLALANIALDHLGSARLLLARAAAADPGLVAETTVELPPDSPVPAEDRLAYFREAERFGNHRIVEPENGDFAETVTRSLLFSIWRLALWQRLARSTDPVLAAIAGKGVAEVGYHRDHAAGWFVTLAQGSAEARRRTTEALEGLWPLWPELFEAHPIETRAAAAGVGVDPAALREECERVLDEALGPAGLTRPDAVPLLAVRGRSGRDGMHTEALSRLLAEAQVVARAHPRGRW